MLMRTPKRRGSRLPFRKKEEITPKIGHPNYGYQQQKMAYEEDVIRSSKLKELQEAKRRLAALDTQIMDKREKLQGNIDFIRGEMDGDDEQLSLIEQQVTSFRKPDVVVPQTPEYHEIDPSSYNEINTSPNDKSPMRRRGFARMRIGLFDPNAQQDYIQKQKNKLALQNDLQEQIRLKRERKEKEERELREKYKSAALNGGVEDDRWSNNPLPKQYGRRGRRRSVRNVSPTPSPHQKQQQQQHLNRASPASLQSPTSPSKYMYSHQRKSPSPMKEVPPIEVQEATASYAKKSARRSPGPLKSSRGSPEKKRSIRKRSGKKSARTNHKSPPHTNKSIRGNVIERREKLKRTLPGTKKRKPGLPPINNKKKTLKRKSIAPRISRKTYDDDNVSEYSHTSDASSTKLPVIHKPARRHSSVDPIEWRSEIAQLREELLSEQKVLRTMMEDLARKFQEKEFASHPNSRHHSPTIQKQYNPKSFKSKRSKQPKKDRELTTEVRWVSAF